MDFKTVQQKLKANIAEHQMILGRLKQNPQDKVLQSNLRQIQKQISDLGIVQKQLGKMKREMNTANASAPVKHENGVKNEAGAPPPFPPGFIKLGPEIASPDNKKLFFRISEPNNSVKSTLPPTSVSDNTKLVTKDNSTVLKKNEFQIALNTDLDFPVTSSKQSTFVMPTKLSSNTNIASQKDNDVYPIYTKNFAEGGLKMPINNVNIAKEFATSEASKKLMVKQPMKIRVPICTGGSIMLFPTAVVKQPVVSPVFRFTSAPQPTTRPQPGNTARLWLNIAGPSGNQGVPQTRFIPTPVRPPGEASDSVGSFQKFRIVGGKTTNALTNAFSPTTVNHTSDHRPTSTRLKAVLMQSSVTSICATTVSTANNRPEGSRLLLSQSHCAGNTRVCPTVTNNSVQVVSEKENPLYTNSVCPQTVQSDNSNEKISFLSYIDLVPQEKANRIRSRRYGKRRAVAHPVYSGGLYVSTTGTDSSKRMIPAELLGIDSDDAAPAKRPRGRPRGSTNKKTFSCLPASDNEDEFMRIYQETKPEGLDSVKHSTNLKDKTVDLCAICHKPGEVLLCDTCSNLYHVSCLTPPLEEVPTGMWFCDACKEKISDDNSAPTWPGIMSVVHSYVVFDGKRKEAINKAREKMKAQKSRKSQLEEQIKILKNILKDKVIAKNMQEKNLKKNTENCEQLTSLLERIRCSVNNYLEAT